MTTLALIGLGKMGANMARRLRRGGIEVVGYDHHPKITQQLAQEEGLIAAHSLSQAVAFLAVPRVVWLMLPAGDATKETVKELADLLSAGDVVVDGGNAHYQDSQRRAALLAERAIRFSDVGTSGGIWGLENGYCLMAGGAPETLAVIEPLLRVLAPAPDRGWAHVGPAGAGHYAKMIHNGIEYGLMQAYAEGFALLRGKTGFDLDLAAISELWRHSSVVRSWLLDLIAEGLARDQTLSDLAPVVADSGEGRWTVQEAITQGVSVPVIAGALMVRFASQDQTGYAERLLSLMRRAFGGHTVKKSDNT